MLILQLFFKVDKVYLSNFQISFHCVPHTFCSTHLWLSTIGRGKPTASSLSIDGFPLMAGLNFQPSDGNPTVISILWQLADGLENVPEM